MSVIDGENIITECTVLSRVRTNRVSLYVAIEWPWKWAINDFGNQFMKMFPSFLFFFFFFFGSVWLHSCLPLFFPFGWDASCSASCRSKEAQSEAPGRWDSRTLHPRLRQSCWKAMVAALLVLCCWILADNRFLPFVDRTHFEWCIQMGRHWHTRCSRGSADIVRIGSLLDRSRKRQDRRESCTPGTSWSCRRTCLTGMRPDTIVWCSLWLWTSTLCRTVIHTGKNLWKVREREREREREKRMLMTSMHWPKVKANDHEKLLDDENIKGRVWANDLSLKKEKKRKKEKTTQTTECNGVCQKQ